TFGSIGMRTLVESFPDRTKEDGTQGVIETSAQLVASDGTPLMQQLGGDRIPDGWNNLSLVGVPVNPPTDLMPRSIDAGRAIRGAALMTRFSSTATADEAGALGQVAAALRDYGLLPQPKSLAHASPSFSASTAASGSNSALGSNWGLNYVAMW